ncbi:MULTISPECIES: hypothetical protein [unclassified Paenibacillus]|uniref:hypothetical protein n=1 Tax=unclassified Paenibacillus TaxID=185978 RepID=UPI000CFDCF3D|nr:MULTISPECIES: hypothetical protein [unclassified Paenibacillus]PRA00620.1 hypothetical protein CQ043_25910 [Paenibacillus sp. MYb63]PRA49844.1 hypothetical protein CQ061_05195 [Paenibacillus sp. MYb67]QZN75746.1 hypothetical protein K5K90_31175 [Paenibacillus sp. DR312]
MKRFYLGFGLTIIVIIVLLSSPTPAEAASKKVNLKLSDGGTYYGEVLNGKPHGKGTARWGETEVYSGDWVSGKRQGKGKYTYTLVKGGGVPFEDYNESNMGHGTGEFTTKTYTGSWINDTYHGKGKEITQWLEVQYLTSDGKVYPIHDRYNNTINDGTFNQGKMSQGYYAIHSSDTVSLGYTDHTTTIVLKNDYFNEKLTGDPYFFDTIINYKKKHGSSEKYIGIKPSEFSKGTLTNGKFTGVTHLIDYSNSVSYAKQVIMNDNVLKENHITSAVFDKDRKQTINEFLQAIKPFSVKINTISDEIMSLKDINYEGMIP